MEKKSVEVTAAEKKEAGKQQEITVKKGFWQLSGVTRWESGYNFCVQLGTFQEAQLLLYKKGSRKAALEIPIGAECRMGDLAALWVGGLDPSLTEYNYRVDQEVFTDPCARAVTGRTVFGTKMPENGHEVRGILPQEADQPSKVPGVFVPYEDMILYKLHVRGFTSQRQSRTVKKGTFAGLKEKIPYLKELGITSVELMPAYDFLEKPKEEPVSQQRAAQVRLPDRVNYWGYTGGFYYAPKGAYCAGKDSIREFQDCVDAFHREGMEVILEFFFGEEISPVAMLDILRYWRSFYHIDGFHLVGSQIPAEMAAQDAALQDVKLMSNGFDVNQIYHGKLPQVKRLAEYNQNFMRTARCFLKGDENQLSSFIWKNRKNPADCGVINYMASQDGFTLADMVSYNERHNEANQENNRDGCAANDSWNCGVEGETRKSSVLALRGRQMKNAVLLLMLSQGTPMIYAGDEMCNSQAGNNNAWCQDNPVGWTDWNRNKRAESMYQFVKAAIAFRKAYPMLHMKRELRDTDYKSLGTPELSYHSERAWFSGMDESSRSIGVMYCGAYARADSEKETAADLYVAYNMSWLEQTLALPNLEEDRHWYRIVDTSEKEDTGFYQEPRMLEEEKELMVPPRTIIVLTGK